MNLQIMDFCWLVVLKVFGFGSNYNDWVKALLTNQEFCVTNGECTTPYFKLENGARQGGLYHQSLLIYFSLL